jgi:nitrite reductase/ring-hydroxylating ferredoxin subunit
MSDQHAPAPPKWREDFPFEMEGDDFITRRDFTRFLMLISASFVTGHAWILWNSRSRPLELYPEAEVCRTSDLQPGKWRVFNYPDAKTPAIIICRENGEFAAFQQKCTHLACPVAYACSNETRAETLTCHCHNGRFDINTGEGIGGPPRELRPLPRIVLKIEGDRVLAIGVSHGELLHG